MAQGIIDGNKLIAEFMNRYKGSTIEDSEDPIVLDIEYDGFSGSEVSRKTRPFNYQDLQYHTSWDWLMPVVDKINKTKIDTTEFINKHGEKGASFMYAISEEVARVDRQSAWELIVEFIRWYNEKNKTHDLS